LLPSTVIGAGGSIYCRTNTNTDEAAPVKPLGSSVKINSRFHIHDKRK